MIKNNKGQTLILFVIMIPLILLFVMYVVDMGVIYQEKNKLDSITKEAVSYAVDHSDEEGLRDKILNMAKLNDDDIIIELYSVDSDITKITLKKDVKAIFGNIIGKKNYEIKSSYKGLIEDLNKKIIKEG